MRRDGDQLDRLFRAAAAAPQEGAPELSPAIETRILAHWRLARSEGEGGSLVAFLRLGLAWACVVVLLSAALSWQVRETGAAEEMLETAPKVNWVWMR